MRKIVDGSIRKLTSRYLIVHWHGFKNASVRLFYRATKTQIKRALMGKSILVSQQLTNSVVPLPGFWSAQNRCFDVCHTQFGMKIGCEQFNRSEVAELRRWVNG